MSAKTLTDELRSVLLYHSLEAPQPNATVDRILNDTVGAAAAQGATAAGSASSTTRRTRRLPVQQLVAASVIAVLLLAAAGINTLRNRTTARTADNAAGGSVPLPGASSNSLGKAVPANPPKYAGTALDCSKIPDGHLTTGKSDQYLLSNGQRGYLYEFLCVGANGQRSASEIQMFEQTGNQLQYRRTLLRAAADQHVDFLTAGADTVRIQASVQNTASGRVRGEVISTAWDLSEAQPGDGHSFTVAAPCEPKDLIVTVVGVPGAAAPSWRLALRNRTAIACALEGYPQVRAQAARAVSTTGMQTLSGTVGGITKAAVPPIIVLSPDATASAILEQSAATAAACPRSSRLTVTLPDGVPLGLLPADLSTCGLVVHPLVGNVRGSD
jgi:uncharacterized protein DUF4232